MTSWILELLSCDVDRPLLWVCLASQKAGQTMNYSKQAGRLKIQLEELTWFFLFTIKAPSFHFLYIMHVIFFFFFYNHSQQLGVPVQHRDLSQHQRFRQSYHNKHLYPSNWLWPGRNLLLCVIYSRDSNRKRGDGSESEIVLTLTQVTSFKVIHLTHFAPSGATNSFIQIFHIRWCTPSPIMRLKCVRSVESDREISIFKYHL